MNLLLLILAGFLVYLLLGCAILATVDRDERLLRWVKAAPRWWLGELAVILWPVLLWCYLRKSNHEA